MSSDEGGPSADSEMFTGLAQELHASREPDETLAVMFEQAKTMLADADHLSVTVRARRKNFTSLGSSSPLAEKVDQLQYELDEGPCVDAAAVGGQPWYRSGDLARDDRWARWSPRAVDLGIRSVLAIQLLNYDEPFGAINMFAEEPDRFAEPHELDRVLLWGVHVSTALASTRTEEGLRTAISARHDIGVAQGILMNALQLDLEGSFHYMARLSSHYETRLHHVAAEIVRTGKIPRL